MADLVGAIVERTDDGAIVTIPNGDADLEAFGGGAIEVEHSETALRLVVVREPGAVDLRLGGGLRCDGFCQWDLQLDWLGTQQPVVETWPMWELRGEDRSMQACVRAVRSESPVRVRARWSEAGLVVDLDTLPAPWFTLDPEPHVIGADVVSSRLTDGAQRMRLVLQPTGGRIAVEAPAICIHESVRLRWSADSKRSKVGRRVKGRIE